MPEVILFPVFDSFHIPGNLLDLLAYWCSTCTWLEAKLEAESTYRFKKKRTESNLNRLDTMNTILPLYFWREGGSVILITASRPAEESQLCTLTSAISSSHTVLDTQAVTLTLLSVGATHIRKTASRRINMQILAIISRPSGCCFSPQSSSETHCLSI